MTDDLLRLVDWLGGAPGDARGDAEHRAVLEAALAATGDQNAAVDATIRILAGV
jgi:hypothetical protein